MCVKKDSAEPCYNVPVNIYAKSHSLDSHSDASCDLYKHQVLLINGKKNASSALIACGSNF